MDPAAELPCHGVVFSFNLQRARRVVVVNALAFVDEGYGGMRVLVLFSSSPNFLYTSSILDDIPVDLVSLLLVARI